jgi:hypothetical protein
VSRHIIRRHCLDLHVSGEVDVGRLHANVRSLVESTLTRLIDATLTGLVPDDVVVQLERVECELGSVSEGELSSELPQRLQQELVRMLEPRILALRRGDDAAAAGSGRAAPAAFGPSGSASGATLGALGFGERATKGASEERLLTPQRSRAELLRHFLEVGSLPWWGKRDGAFDPDVVIEGLRSSPDDLVQAVCGLGERAVERLLKQCSARSHGALLQALASASGHDVKRLERGLNGCQQLLLTANAGGAPELALSALPGLLQAEALSFFIGASTRGATLPQLAEWLVVKVAAQLELSAPALTRAVADAAARSLSPDTEEARAWLAPLSWGSSAATERATPLTSSGAALGHAEGEPASHRSPRDAVTPPFTEARRPQPRLGPQEEVRRLPDRAGPPRFSSGGAVGALNGAAPVGALLSIGASVALDEAGLYLDNAGLVLLWPYLPQYFRTLGLLAGKSFVSAAARARAALLLQHLVTGRDEYVEHELVLNKVLTGLPLDTPVERRLRLSDGELCEGESLLSSVIDNWKILQRTSIDGFRSAFLVREGHLVNVEGSFKLRVGRKGHDMLLDTLPWGIGVVALSWMERTLWVEW